MDACEEAGLDCAVFADVRGNPVEANVRSGVAAFRAGDHDGVIAFGGGSALDTGKAIALMVGQSRPIWDFEDREDWWTRVDEAGMAPVVAVPTTSGTGSETGRASAITDTRGDYVKRIIFHPAMMPGRVILDPELTAGLPADLTAAVGMDALSHSLEAFSSPVFHPLAQGIALEGIRLVREALPAAVEDGADLAARARMQVAASMGSTAFQKGARRDALAQPPLRGGARHPSRPHQRGGHALRARLQPARHRGADGRPRPLPRPSGPLLCGACSTGVLGLRERIGIPHTLKEIGVDEPHAHQLAPMAAIDPSSPTNPVPLDAENLEALYLRAINGVL